jgi:hypothetical protein
MEKENKGSGHMVVHKKLVDALMEHAMQPVEHFAAGGLAGMLGAANNFDSQGPMMTSQNLSPQIQQQYKQQQDVYGQQQGLANQLQQQTMGGGPAQQLVAQQGANAVNQQAALMASQRGASQNAGLVARQAAQAGAGLQQQTMNTQAGLALQSQGALAQQQAQMAGQSLQAQGILQGAVASQNQANMASQGINAQIQGQNAATSGNILGGLIQGGAAALGKLFAHGGQVSAPQKMATGGMAQYAQSPIPTLGLQGGFQGLGEGLAKGLAQPKAAAAPQFDPFNSPGAPMVSQLQEGNAPAGYQTISPNIFESGGPVPGQAKVAGDSGKNDTVPAMLSPGEIVLPRSVTQGGNVEAKAVEFLRHLRGSKKGYGSVIEARKMNCGGKA